jgi:prolipoprotein diacylglyceryltransferase
MPPIIIWNIDPVIFMLTPTFPIKYYGILFALGITIAFLIVKSIYRHEGKLIEELDTLLIYIVLGTVLGARLGHCLFYEPEYYLNHPLEIILPFKKIDGAYHYIGFKVWLAMVVLLAFYSQSFFTASNPKFLCCKYLIESPLRRQ